MSSSNYALPNKEYMPYTLISLKQKSPGEEAVSGTNKERDDSEKELREK